VLADSGFLLSQSLPGSVAEIVAAVRGLGLEGVVAKRKDSAYEPGERSGAWQKVKLEQQQEFVVGGYRPGSNGIDALLVGSFHGKKPTRRLRPARRPELFAKLKPRYVDRCPFVDLPNSRSSPWAVA
jgi:bifunctional non-homologous end joining protein LigD